MEILFCLCLVVGKLIMDAFKLRKAERYATCLAMHYTELDRRAGRK